MCPADCSFEDTRLEEAVEPLTSAGLRIERAAAVARHERLLR